MLKSTVLAVLAVATLSGTAHATNFPDTRKMTCREARNLVKAHSPIILQYGYSPKAGRPYSKFYSMPCRQGDDWGPAGWVKTSDSPSCFIGYVCNN